MFPTFLPTAIPTVSTFLAIAMAGGSVDIVDGDTIDLDGRRIRIANIDAPEIFSPKCNAELRLGKVSARRLADLLGAAGKITVVPGDPSDGRTIDRYGRTLATIKVDGRDVGEILVAEDLARLWTGRRESWCD